MFLLYAVAIGIVTGVLLGGRIAGLASITIRWPAAIVGGLLVQVVLFTPLVAERVGDQGALFYVGSTLLVDAALVRNWRLPGMSLVAAGAACNLVAILANGGWMPAGRDAMVALRGAAPVASGAYSNSSLSPDPVLPFLTDVFVLPRWVPFANVFSVGDVLIGAGIALVIVLAMRSGRTQTQVNAPATADVPDLA